MTPSDLIEMAQDPTLIKGIYDMCDEWCRYCGAKNRCLAYRSSPRVSQMRRPTSDEDGERDHFFESLLSAKWLAEAEGRPAPTDIETALSGDLDRQKRMFRIDDPLERVGRQYMTTATAYFKSRADYPVAPASGTHQPTPLEVLSWFHALVPARIFRALLSAIEAREGIEGRHHDSLAAAKLALVGIERSLDALARLAAQDDDPRLDLLHAQLTWLGPEVERRFPGARSWVRPGLDVSLAAQAS